MIPLIVCRAYSSEDFLGAAALICAAILTGWVASRLAKPIGFWMGWLIGILLPTAAFFGLLPFDPKWKYDCGATPDPSILVTGASIIFPALLCVVFLGSKRLKRLRS